MKKTLLTTLASLTIANVASARDLESLGIGLRTYF
jgi:hypothetical protein